MLLVSQVQSPAFEISHLLIFDWRSDHFDRVSDWRVIMPQSPNSCRNLWLFPESLRVGMQEPQILQIHPDTGTNVELLG